MTKIDTEARRKAFEDALKEVSKLKGGTQIALMPELKEDVETYSSGSLVLDSILGGGIPKGRIIEIYGPEGSGKTSIALTALANVQREGGNCAFLDVEQAFDPHYARTLGVDTSRLAFSQPSIAEDALRMIMELIQTGTVDLIVLDSVAALTPKAEFEADIEKASMASLARVMSKVLKMLVPIANEKNCTVIFINQIRDNVGAMWGPATSTPGGKALKFFASQRVEVKKVKLVTEGDKTIGTEVKLKCIKNKIAPPYGEGMTVLTFARGINTEAEVMVIGEALEIIKATGRTYRFESDEEIDISGHNSIIEEEGSVEEGKPWVIKIATSKAALMKEIAENKNLANAINKKISETLKKNIEEGIVTEE